MHAPEGQRYEVRLRDGLGYFWAPCTTGSVVVSRDDQWDKHLSYMLMGSRAFGMAKPGDFRIRKGRS